MSEVDKIGDEQSRQADVPQDKQEQDATMVEEPKGSGAPTPTKDEKYRKLKQRFDALKKEYLSLLQNWEESNQRVSQLSQERKFLRDKLTYFLRSQKFHGKVTDEDLALSLLARSQSSTTAGGVSQSQLQVEQLLSLAQLAQQKQSSSQQQATTNANSNAKPIQVSGGGSTKAQKNAAAALASQQVAALQEAMNLNAAANQEFAKPQPVTASVGTLLNSNKNPNTVTIMQKVQPNTMLQTVAPNGTTPVPSTASAGTAFNVAQKAQQQQQLPLVSAVANVGGLQQQTQKADGGNDQNLNCATALQQAHTQQQQQVIYDETNLAAKATSGAITGAVSNGSHSGAQQILNQHQAQQILVQQQTQQQQPSQEMIAMQQAAASAAQQQQILLSGSAASELTPNQQQLLIQQILQQQLLSQQQQQSQQIQQESQDTAAQAAAAIEMMKHQTQAHVTKSKKEQDIVHLNGGVGGASSTSTSKRQKVDKQHINQTQSANNNGATSVKIRLFGNQAIQMNGMSNQLGNMLTPAQQQALLSGVQSAASASQQNALTPAPPIKKPRKRSEKSINAQLAKQQAAAAAAQQAALNTVGSLASLGASIKVVAGGSNSGTSTANKSTVVAASAPAVGATNVQATMHNAVAGQNNGLLQGNGVPANAQQQQSSNNVSITLPGIHQSIEKHQHQQKQQVVQNGSTPGGQQMINGMQHQQHQEQNLGDYYFHMQSKLALAGSVKNNYDLGVIAANNGQGAVDGSAGQQSLMDQLTQQSLQAQGQTATASNNNSQQIRQITMNGSQIIFNGGAANVMTTGSTQQQVAAVNSTMEQQNHHHHQTQAISDTAALYAAAAAQQQQQAFNNNGQQASFQQQQQQN